MIDLTMHEERLQHAIDRAKERNILDTHLCADAEPGPHTGKR